MPSIKNSQRTVQLLISKERRGPAFSVLPNVIYLSFARSVCVCVCVCVCMCVCVCVWKSLSHTAEMFDIGTPVD